VRAIRLQAPGGPEILQLEDVPVPTPGPGQVLLQVEAAGLNYIDVYHRTGLYKQPFPLTLGREAGGTVEAVGPGVTTVRAGDRVASESVVGSYAEYALVPAERLVPLPGRVTTKLGAAVMLQGLTAHYLVHSTYPLERDDICVVHAAAGGVGTILCQWARHLGATVIGTVGSEAKAKLAADHGCQYPIIYSKEDFVKRVREITNGEGVPVVYDSVGKDTFLKSLDCLRPRGIMVLFGQSSGAVEPFNLGLLAQKGSLYVTRPTLATYAATRADLVATAEDLFDVVREGYVKIEVNQTFPLKDAAAAHRALEGRKTTGSTVLIP